MNGSPDLSVRIGKLVLKNPVMPASGTFGYGQEFERFIDIERLGATLTKTITWKPRLGSFPHRSTEGPSGLLASIGLQNVGVDRFIQEKLPYFESKGVPLFVSIGGETVGAYLDLAERLNRQKRIDGLELNVSCPNVKRGGLHFGVVPEILGDLVMRVRQVTHKTLIVKLSPLVPDIRIVAEVSQQSGADAVSLINGLPGLAIDIETRRSKLGRNVTGGWVGPAIRPFALYLVRRVYQSVDIPVIGVGGIGSSEDAIAFLISGASAIQIGTYQFVDPAITLKAIDGIAAYMRRHRMETLRQLIGSLKAEVALSQKDRGASSPGI